MKPIRNTLCGLITWLRNPDKWWERVPSAGNMVPTKGFWMVIRHGLFHRTRNSHCQYCWDLCPSIDLSPFPRISSPDQKEATAEVRASEAVQFSLEFEDDSEKMG